LIDFLNKNKLVRCGFKSAIRRWPNPSENFSDFSVIYSHFPLSYFYLLEGSKIFFHELKILYLSSSHPKSSLVIFLNFSELSEYFS
jgi:hypothetical protein